MSRSVLFVGSLGLEDGEAAFRAVGKHVGNRAGRYPDGEPGARKHWIRWQAAVLDRNPHFVLAEDTRPLDQRQLPISHRALKPGVRAEDIAFDSLGYADEAIASYAVFKRLKSEKAIPAATRLQVSLPTPIAFVTTHIVPELQAAIEPAYERAMENEIRRMVNEIPPAELAVQWDVCHEIIALDGGMKIHCGADAAATVSRVVRLCNYVPEPVELGLHLCYGDPGHKHICEPNDLGTCVRIVNAVAAKASRPITWVHIPVPRDRTDDAYFAPLDGLRVKPTTEVYLGLVHYTDGVDGTIKRIDAASKHLAAFGIATECGFGRRDPATIPGLLDVHAAAADRT